ncbi:MAG: hypothetical protein J7604_03600 [Sporocytophaga sp.]|uniref:hypothetical protein n=1 Tax=Sporocytophaga sp. TaxID=2231183 RepID=UPI001B181597|nr:hypothetical protein [Sporocytophaga sp.]MBO9699266.1 hypothetical protein [Sporocytophaga sp.]
MFDKKNDLITIQIDGCEEEFDKIKESIYEILSLACSADGLTIHNQDLYFYTKLLRSLDKQKGGANEIK